MGLMREIGKGPVCLDTAVFIYFIEEHEKFLPIVLPLFEAIDKGCVQAITSGITLLETLVIPLRVKDFKLADQYEHLLLNSDGLTTLFLDPNLLRHAAILRAAFELKTPDAIQVAAAQLSQCSCFITNDRRLPKISGLKILQLSDYLRK